MLTTQIIHRIDRSLLAEVKMQGEFVIHSEPLKNELMISGIPVPHFLRDQYGGKRVVEWDDPEFKKAFLEIYFPNQLREAGYIKV